MDKKRVKEVSDKLLSKIKEGLGGLTNTYIAEHTGITEANVSRILTGKQLLTLSTFILLCDVAKVEYWEVWQEAGNE